MYCLFGFVLRIALSTGIGTQLTTPRHSDIDTLTGCSITCFPGCRQVFLRKVRKFLTFWYERRMSDVAHLVPNSDLEPDKQRQILPS